MPNSLPDYDSQAIMARLKQELPGADFQVASEPSGYGTMVIRGKLKVHRFESGVDELLPVPDFAIEAWVDSLVRSVRRDGVKAYGLQAEIDEQVAEAKADAIVEARKELRAQLEAKLNASRDDNGLLPYALAVAGDWLHNELGRPEVKSSKRAPASTTGSTCSRSQIQTELEAAIENLARELSRRRVMATGVGLINLARKMGLTR
jgi:hypothetical protein